MPLTRTRVYAAPAAPRALGRACGTEVLGGRAQEDAQVLAGGAEG